MTPIICKNDLRTVIDKIQEYLEKEGTIQGIRLVDNSESQAVFLIDDQLISQRDAELFWTGYCSALGS
jgi:hypothetical protein